MIHALLVIIVWAIALPLIGLALLLCVMFCWAVIKAPFQAAYWLAITLPKGMAAEMPAIHARVAAEQAAVSPKEKAQAADDWKWLCKIILACLVLIYTVAGIALVV